MGELVAGLYRHYPLALCMTGSLYPVQINRGFDSHARYQSASPDGGRRWWLGQALSDGDFLKVFFRKRPYRIVQTGD